MSTKQKQFPTIAGIVLAAGRSKRMGSAKPFLALQSVTFVQVILGRMNDAGLASVTVVTNPAHRDRYEQLTLPRADLIENDKVEKGMLYSLQLGIRSLPKRVTHAMVTLVDMPDIRTSTFIEAAECALNHPETIVRSGFEGKFGHPVIFPNSFFEEILTWEGHSGPRGFVAQHESQVFDLETKDVGTIMDYDTPNDFRKRRSC